MGGANEEGRFFLATQRQNSDKTLAEVFLIALSLLRGAPNLEGFKIVKPPPM